MPTKTSRFELDLVFDATSTGYDITYRGPLPIGVEEPVLQPIGPGGQTRKGDDPRYLQEIIDRLNSIFGQATPVRDQAAFANQIAAIAKEREAVVAQIENNSREQALKGNLPGAVSLLGRRGLPSSAYRFIVCPAANRI